MHNEAMQGEIVDATDTGESAPMAIAARAEIDVQIATAHQYPRSLARFRKQATDMATLDEETAGTMFYCIKRGGKKIEGPSVRLAEVVGCTWGNLRYGAEVVDIGDQFVTAVGFCHDLESNNACRVSVQRRITDKHGKRYKEDMIGVTANAACSIALRNAMFKVVPFSLVKPIYDDARITSIGNATSMAAKRDKAICWFAGVGVSEADVLAYLEREGAEEITSDDLITLRGLVNAIKEGDTTIEEAMGKSSGVGGGRVSASSLNDELKLGAGPEEASAEGGVRQSEAGGEPQAASSASAAAPTDQAPADPMADAFDAEQPTGSDGQLFDTAGGYE